MPKLLCLDNMRNVEGFADTAESVGREERKLSRTIKGMESRAKFLCTAVEGKSRVFQSATAPCTRTTDLTSIVQRQQTHSGTHKNKFSSSHRRMKNTFRLVFFCLPGEEFAQNHAETINKCLEGSLDPDKVFLFPFLTSIIL